MLLFACASGNSVEKLSQGTGLLDESTTDREFVQSWPDPPRRHDNPKLWLPVPGFAGETNAVRRARHVDVRDQQEDFGMGLEYLESLDAVASFVGDKTLITQHVCGDHSNDGFVVDNERDLLRG